jgi:ribosome biogenesis GTPase
MSTDDGHTPSGSTLDTLTPYGWSPALQAKFQTHADQDLIPGRVVVQQRGLVRLITSSGEFSAGFAGRLTHEAAPGDLPVAGDWVAAALHQDGSGATIHHVLPRSSAFVRRASGPGGGLQVVAANVDLAFVTVSLNADLSLRRIERYLASAWESRAAPIVVLTKADLCANVEVLKAEVEAIAVGAPVFAVSALTGEGLNGLFDLLGYGRTAVLLGSSGAGKSTLVNALAGAQLMATQAIIEEGARGRHTTSHRELVLLPRGGMLLDTPGMRELGLWEADTGLSATFADIEALTARCRFHDCAHETEPGCAIRAALEGGVLDPGRWRGFQKLQRELAHLDRREDPIARIEARRVWIQRTKAYRARKRSQDEEY